jgi:hypothetical protein
LLRPFGAESRTRNLKKRERRNGLAASLTLRDSVYLGRGWYSGRMGDDSGKVQENECRPILWNLPPRMMMDNERPLTPTLSPQAGRGGRALRIVHDRRVVP